MNTDNKKLVINMKDKDPFKKFRESRIDPNQISLWSDPRWEQAKKKYDSRTNRSVYQNRYRI